MTNTKTLALRLLLTLTVLSGGCAHVPFPISEPVSQNPAVISLYEEAVAHTARQQYPQAKSSLERALRLEARNAWLWYELAIVHREQGNTREAHNLALRAKSYATNARLNAHIEKFLAELAPES